MQEMATIWLALVRFNLGLASQQRPTFEHVLSNLIHTRVNLIVVDVFTLYLAGKKKREREKKQNPMRITR